jgi:thiol:disulfide interchange protein
MTARHFCCAARRVVADRGAAVAQNRDVIPPEQAFKYTTADAQKIYLKLRSSMVITIGRASVRYRDARPDAQRAQFPKGEIHSDEYFGEQRLPRQVRDRDPVSPDPRQLGGAPSSGSGLPTAASVHCSRGRGVGCRG